jgi:hypothetical protein
MERLQVSSDFLEDRGSQEKVEREGLRDFLPTAAEGLYLMGYARPA